MRGSVQHPSEGDHLVVAHDDEVLHIGVVFKGSHDQVAHCAGHVVGPGRVHQVCGPAPVGCGYGCVGLHLDNLSIDRLVPG